MLHTYGTHSPTYLWLKAGRFTHPHLSPLAYAKLLAELGHGELLELPGLGLRFKAAATPPPPRPEQIAQPQAKPDPQKRS
jgi:hypothetical protein